MSEDMYLIFAYNNYYPFGGYGDFKCMSDNKKHINNAITKNLKEYDVVDLCKLKDEGLVFIADITYEKRTFNRRGGYVGESNGAYITVWDDEDRERMNE